VVIEEVEVGVAEQGFARSPEGRSQLYAASRLRRANWKG
jgi:hypothetical protein